jgi:hypothetical protein
MASPAKGFDPDKFLAETAPKQQTSSFDPDKFLAETAPKEEMGMPYL